MGQIGKAREGRWCRDRLARRPFENSKGESMMIEAERGLGRDKLHGRRRLLAAGMRRRHSVGTTLPAHVSATRLLFGGGSLCHTRHKRSSDDGQQQQQSRDFCRSIHGAVKVRAYPT